METQETKQTNTKDANVKKSSPLQCVVVSTKMAKSRVGQIDRLVKESHLGKYIARKTKIMFHDEENASQMGDSVLIMPCRPKSARKKFELVKIVKKAKAD